MPRVTGVCASLSMKSVIVICTSPCHRHLAPPCKLSPGAPLVSLLSFPVCCDDTKPVDVFFVSLLMKVLFDDICATCAMKVYQVITCVMKR